MAARPERHGSLDLGDELRTLGPRAHDRHVPAQDVPELRQLVDPRPAHEAPRSRHAWIVRRSPDRGTGLFRVVTHRPELEHHERSAAFAQPWLAEDDRSGRPPYQ